MDITDIYDAASARGLARSLRHFSTAVLGMAPNYAAETRLTRCSAAALLRLHRRLGELGQADLQAQVVDRLLAAAKRNGAVPAVRP